MKKIFLILTIATFTIGCSKDDETIAISVASILDESLVNSNIAFIKGDAKSIIENEETVDEFFQKTQPHSVRYVKSYREYMSPGDYTILIQIAESGLNNKYKTYSFKYVTISKENGFVSNMVFKSNINEFYQPWNDKTD